MSRVLQEAEYAMNENSITFVVQMDVGGPNEQDSSYSLEFYLLT